MNKKGRTKQLKYKARKQRKKPFKKRSKGMIREETKRSASKKDEKPGQQRHSNEGRTYKSDPTCVPPRLVELCLCTNSLRLSVFIHILRSIQLQVSAKNLIAYFLLLSIPLASRGQVTFLFVIFLSFETNFPFPTEYEFKVLCQHKIKG